VASVSRLGFAALGVAVAFAAFGGPTQAQDAKPAATAAVASVDAAKVAKGKDVFANYGCGGCHSLADAGATGHVGPAFDGDSNLSESFVTDRVTNGSGPMPAFGGQMTPEEVSAIAYYVTHAAAKP
jgi:mono/diheme cytochrome c family protein